MPIINPNGTFVPKTMKFLVDLPNFPEWAIPFTKIIPKCRVDDPYLNEGLTLQCKHFWKYISENHWQIYVEINAIGQIGGDYFPVYLDVDLVIINERVWEEINSNKN